MDYDIEKDEYMKDWKEVRLGDVAEILTGYPFKSIMYSNEGKLRVVRGDNVTERELRWGEKTRFWNNNTEGLEKFFLEENDIVIGMDGSKVGKNKATVKKNDLPLILAQRVACIRAKSGIVQKYLSHQILNDKFLNYVESIKTGTSIPHISLKQIADFKMSLPKYEIQQKIAQILSSLDDKIELNNAINKNLEEIAQTLFKQWFVDFEFPASLASPLFQGGDREGDGYKSSGGEMVESELGEIPKGWRVDNLEGIASYLNGLAMQKFPPENENDYLPVIKIKELRTGITNDSDKASINIDKKYIINDGDILFSWSGSLEVVIWTGGTGGLNQHLFKVTSEIFEKWFYYLWTKYHLEKFRHIAESKATTMGHIKREDLKKSLVVIPNELELDKMNNIFNPVLSKIIKNSIETQTLTKLRDELLPKLMSGEVRV